MQPALHTDLHEATRQITEAIALFSPEQFNTVPFAGSWTAGQVADHLLQSISGIPEILQGPAQPTNERPPDQKVKDLAAIFLDYNARYQSPEFILPGKGPHQPDRFLQGFRQVHDAVAQAMTELPSDDTCTLQDFPTLGHLTRQEWVHFMNYHTLRHARQMRNIYARLQDANEQA